MSRIRSINGLPNEVTQKYISTLMYFDKGYMMDWISKSLKELNIDFAEIDLFTESSRPNDFITKPIKVYFKELRSHIKKRLVQNGFESDYINQGVFKIHISEFDQAFGNVSIQCLLTTKENRMLTGKVYSEKTYPIADSFLERIMKKIKN